MTAPAAVATPMCLVLELPRALRHVADWRVHLPELRAWLSSPMIVGHPPANDPEQSIISIPPPKRRRALRDHLSMTYVRRGWEGTTGRGVN